MDGMDGFLALMFWSAISLPMLGFALCVVVGILITPIEMNRATRRVVVGAGVALVLMCLPGLALLVL